MNIIIFKRVYLYFVAHIFRKYPELSLFIKNLAYLMAHTDNTAKCRWVVSGLSGWLLDNVFERVIKVADLKS